MEIVYSHIKEPIRKGATPAEVFLEFRTKIAAAKLEPKEEEETISRLRFAIGLAWDEVRPIALMNRKAAAKEAAKDAAPRPTPHCDGGMGGI